MKPITHPRKRLPKKYGGFYIGPTPPDFHLTDITTKTGPTARGTHLDIICAQKKERENEPNRFKMERPEFIRPLSLQETIKYGAILYIVAILITIPAGISTSSQQPLAYDIQITTDDLISELLLRRVDLNQDQMTLAMVPGLGMELLPSPEAPKAPPFIRYIMLASQAYEVDSALIRAIIMVESSCNPRAVSHRGARGLMQLMPVTAKWLGVEDAFDPALNIDGGVRYLRRLLDRFDGNIELALAAYNAGSRYVLKYGGIPPFRATRSYIKKVLWYHQQYQVEMAPSLTSLRMS
jgi:hypothetical protein